MHATKGGAHSHAILLHVLPAAAIRTPLELVPADSINVLFDKRRTLIVYICKTVHCLYPKASIVINI